MKGNCRVINVEYISYHNSVEKRWVWKVVSDDGKLYYVDKCHVIGTPPGLRTRAILTYEETGYGMAYMLRSTK